MKVPHGPAPMIGILHCGELGSAFGELLRKSGFRVVTTCQDRSQATQERAQSSGVEILATLREVVAQSHLVFSFVFPSGAVDIAQQYARWAHLRPQDSIFVDGNSVGLESIEEIKRIMAVHNIHFVDATVNGGANRLEGQGVLHVSGSKAGEVEAICRQFMQVNLLGERAGAATCLKLLMSGIAKGLPALFLEVSALAERAGMSDAFLQSCNQFYPDLMKMIERTLITYPRHASRRVLEIAEIEQMGHIFRLRPGMTHEACELTRLAASLDWEHLPSGSPADLRTIIQCVAKAFAFEDRFPRLPESSNEVSNAIK